MDDLLKPLRALSLNDVEVTGKEIGRGAYGVVLEVKVSGLSCAGKKLHDAIAGEFLVKQFIDECLNHSQLRHPNIVQLMGVYFPPDSDTPILVMERLQVSLARCLDEAPLPLSVKYNILLDVANGLNYLHHKTPPIIHRDLTAQNILLTKSFNAKISDLGVCRLLDPVKSRCLTVVPGNPVVMPPEAFINDQLYDRKLDIFSYGCLILHIFTQEWPIPVSQLPQHEPLNEWQRRFTHITAMGVTHPMMPLTKICLHNEPTCRPTMGDIIHTIQAILPDPSPGDTMTVDLGDLYDVIMKTPDIESNSQVASRRSYHDELERCSYHDEPERCSYHDKPLKAVAADERLISSSYEDIHSTIKNLENQDWSSSQFAGGRKSKYQKLKSFQPSIPHSPLSRKYKSQSLKDSNPAETKSLTPRFSVSTFAREKGPPPLPPPRLAHAAAGHYRFHRGSPVATPPSSPKFKPRVKHSESFSPAGTPPLPHRLKQLSLSNDYEKDPTSPKSPLGMLVFPNKFDSPPLTPVMIAPHHPQWTPPLSKKKPKLPNWTPTLSSKFKFFLKPKQNTQPTDSSNRAPNEYHSNPGTRSLAEEYLMCPTHINSSGHEWYHHRISNDIAKSILMERDKKDGNFVIGSNSVGEYHLSVFVEGIVTHIRIYMDTRGYFLLDSSCCENEKSFASLEELVAYYRKFPLHLKENFTKLKLLTD